MTPGLLDYPRVALRVPPSACGIAQVVHEECSRLDAAALAISLGPGLPIDGGIHAALKISGDAFMSDFEYERKTCLDLAHHARGSVLIAGLGLGMVLPPLLDDREVGRVTVIEKVADVIALIAPHYAHKKLTIIHGDIFDWRPTEQTFDTIYFDIWPSIGQMNLIQMEYLHRAFGSVLAVGGWMESWMRRELLRKTRLEARRKVDPFAEEMGGCGNLTTYKPETAAKLLGVLTMLRTVSLKKARTVATSPTLHERVGTHVLPNEVPS